MATMHKALYASVAAASVALWSVPTSAQIDVDPPLPNLMLLVDTSGSMEYLPNGDPVTVCDPTGQSDMNRWATLVSVLTGSVQNRGCYAQQRNSNDFVNEFSLGGDPPYDKSYFLPHHRIVSNGCVAGPGTLPPNLYDWPNGAIKYHAHDDANQACAVPFEQSKDGLLDVYRDRVRFGLMTFDPQPHGGTGVSGGAPDFGNGMEGMWSYYLNWQGGGSPVQGSLPGCAVKLLEVGARNAAAPPWEGRMISLGRSDAPLLEIQQTNAHIQEALLTMRPYGATPLAAMLADAYVYYRQDTSADPVNPSHGFGPATDPMFADGCRKSYLVVLSDGEPNLDLRPFCEAQGGSCPYKEPWEIAGDLANSGNTNQQVLTFAVGFGLSQAAGVDCNTIVMPTDLQNGGLCDSPTGALKACCTLSRIAYEGGTPKAYFADNLSSLKTELQAIIDAVAGEATSRTMPAFAGAVSTQASKDPNFPAKAVSYEFTTSFKPGIGELWAGNLERHRWVCETQNGALVPVLKDVDDNLGDDFAYNLNEGKLTKPRQFYTVVANSVQQGGVTVRDSEGTIRPNLVQDDGLGVYSGVTVGGTESLVSTIMGTAPESMDMVPLPAACSEPNLGATSPSQCALRVMKWELGGVNGGGLPSRSGNEFGAIYHATPDLMGAPRAFIRDPSYERFANLKTTRPLVLYTATTDGQLHAFKVASNDPNDTGVLVDKPENNELWSFLPPHVLPNLISQYPSVQQILLDGPPVLKDVVFERTLTEAQAGGTSAGAEWRSVLVAGGRGAGGFYYALDVTDPELPVFLWQISYIVEGGVKKPLFGEVSGAPAIAMVSIKDGTDVKEVAVAILPGGDGTLMSGKCARQKNGPWTHFANQVYTPRNEVRCWQAGPSRSLTIVRLSDGQVLKTFRGVSNDGPATINSSLVKVVGFDSPITGHAVPYPSQVGQVADRVYVGDADGGLWRIDLSNPDPAQWDAHLAFDAYALDQPEASQAIQGAPVIAVDGLGNTVILLSTGDQETFHLATTGMRNYIWSILERPEPVGTIPFSVDINWGIPFDDGKRVTGPIALFDEVAYFATFTPQPVGINACSDGAGSVWGVDYLETQGTATPPAPQPRLPVDPNANPIVYVDEDPQPAGTVVFGVAVTQEPACYDTSTVTDDYVGATYTTISQSSPPTFVLKWHTGQQGGTASTGAETKTESRVLPTPKQTTRIDSWASVIE